jgi:adenylate cyclase
MSYYNYGEDPPADGSTRCRDVLTGAPTLGGIGTSWVTSMTAHRPPDDSDEAFWRDYLTRGNSVERRMRRVLKRLPHDPRCGLCAAPFAGSAGRVMRLIGKRPSTSNPNMCDSCFTFLRTHHGGAEIECTMLFADIRGSTTLAEAMVPATYHDMLDRFYTTASGVVFDHDGTVDKFVGDELVAMFFPLLTGERHAARGLEAAHALLRATGDTADGVPWVPLGAGLHTGNVWFGAVGRGAHIELTALGDGVNITARLASLAAAGEILVTSDAARAAGLDASLERRVLELKGKHLVTEVVSLRVA